MLHRFKSNKSKVMRWGEGKFWDTRAIITTVTKCDISTCILFLLNLLCNIVEGCYIFISLFLPYAYLINWFYL